MFVPLCVRVCPLRAAFGFLFTACPLHSSSGSAGFRGRTALPGGGATSRSRSSGAGGVTDELERVKRKQQKELEAMLAYEQKMQAIAEEQERKEVRAVCVCMTLCV